MIDCKFESPMNCENRPINGLSIVAHCLACWLARDWADAAAKMAKHERNAKIWRAGSEARLERLKRECGLNG